MKQFLKKALILFIPIVIWGLIVMVIDPFNYFGNNIIDNKSKIDAENLNTLMYRTFDYLNEPCENILIGDSRTDALPIDLIEKISKKKYKKLNTNAAKLNEIFDLFYLANKKKHLKQVVIGINFNMFNKYGYEDRVSGLTKMTENPLMYLYNKDVNEATYYTIKNLFSKGSMTSQPRMTREEFWKWNLTTKATHWYGKFAFPEKLYAQLLAFDDYTKKHKIEVLFIIVPHNREFHQQLTKFGLDQKEQEFKKIMSQLHATVYDYDYSNVITKNKNNYQDPVHYNDTIGKLIVTEIWGNKLLIGKKIN